MKTVPMRARAFPARVMHNKRVLFRFFVLFNLFHYGACIHERNLISVHGSFYLFGFFFIDSAMHVLQLYYCK